MRVSESKLKGKYALITGASSGIGKGIVELFLKAGAFVCAISRNPDKLKHLKKEMGEQKENLLCFPCDISKSSEVSKALDQVKQQYPRLDVLVNNAGIMKAGTIMDVEEKDWDKMVNVNLKGILFNIKIQPADDAGWKGRIHNQYLFHFRCHRL